ncbi:MAG: endonuclease VII domain-containing protein [Actinomycetota bacterium]|nr:endonuclease VII domain-containing protein [Actinomycetota bacterium]
MKQCRKCGLMKPLDDFYRSTGMRDGHRHDCKACNLDEKHRRYLADPEPTKARVKRWQQENPERLNAYRRSRRLEPEVKRRERAGHLMRKYGVTLEAYDAMLEGQGGGCAVCSRTPRENSSLHVDHDHATGQIRGLLCFSCNNALADFQENRDLLRNAIGYLMAHTHAGEIELARERAFSLVGAGRRGGCPGGG